MSDYPELKVEKELLHSEDYHGHQIVVHEVHQTREGFTWAPYRSHTGSLITPYPETAIDRLYLEVRLDGRSYQGWSISSRGTNLTLEIPKLVKKAKKAVDQTEFDASIRSAVTRLISATKNSSNLVELGYSEVIGRSVSDETPVYVHGTGYWRRGLIVKRGRQNVTVAYTTPSSNGRIFYKSVEKVWAPK